MRIIDSSNKILYAELKIVASNMRKSPTRAEAMLWGFLRKRQLGVKFRRQYIIDKFIVDFCCLEKSLIIEVDGSMHDNQPVRDRERSDILSELGFKIFRITNTEAVVETNQTILKIKKEISERHLPL